MQDQLNNTRANDTSHQHEIQQLQNNVATLKNDIKRDTKALNEVVDSLFSWKQGDQITTRLKTTILNHHQTTTLPSRVVSFFNENQPTALELNDSRDENQHDVEETIPHSSHRENIRKQHITTRRLKVRALCGSPICGIFPVVF